MMTNLDTQIGTSFLIVRPCGWHGRPWDSMHDLLRVTSEENHLALEFSNQVRIDIRGDHREVFLADGIFLFSTRSWITSKMQKSEFGRGTYLLLRGQLDAEQRLFELHQAFSAFQSIPSAD